MSLHIERVQDVVVLVPEGMLKGSTATGELEATLRGLAEERHAKILLDLAKTTFMSSDAIGVLTHFHSLASDLGLHFFVCLGSGGAGTRPAPRGAGRLLHTIEPVSALRVRRTRDEALRELATL